MYMIHPRLLQIIQARKIQYKILTKLHYLKAKLWFILTSRYSLIEDESQIYAVLVLKFEIMKSLFNMQPRLGILGICLIF